MCLYRESGPVLCLYRGWAEGVHVQSVTQILVAPVKVGPITAVTHHCCWAFTPTMVTMMTI